MRKTMNMAIIYFFAAMAGGVYYRELTKLNNFTGFTVLGVVHTHLFALGAFLLLSLAIGMRVVDFTQDRRYNTFFWIYNISFLLMILTMVVKGTQQVLGFKIGSSFTAALAGIAGLSHAGIAVAIGLLLFIIKKQILSKK